MSVLLRHVRTATGIDRDVRIAAAGRARRGCRPLRPGRDRVLALRRLGGRLLCGLDHAAARRRRHRRLAATTFLGSPRSSRTTAGATIRRRTTTEALGYERGEVRLELTYLVRDGDGRIVTPLRDRQAPWPDGAFGDDERELLGVRSRLIGLAALTRGKSSSRDDPEDAAKDRADFGVLSDL